MPSTVVMIKEDLSDVGRLFFPLYQQDANVVHPFAGRWTLDPIDGTKGFLRGGQYAICLALIVDGDVKLGVIGCPNLPVGGVESEDGQKGCILTAIKGQGAEQVNGAYDDTRASALSHIHRYLFRARRARR